MVVEVLESGWNVDGANRHGLKLHPFEQCLIPHEVEDQTRYRHVPDG